MMRHFGRADLLPLLTETVWVVPSTGSMVTAFTVNDDAVEVVSVGKVKVFDNEHRLAARDHSSRPTAQAVLRQAQMRSALQHVALSGIPLDRRSGSAMMAAMAGTDPGPSATLLPTALPGGPARGQASDGLRVEQAANALLDAPDVQVWADRFAVLGDENRLRILLAVHRAPGLTVSAVARVVGMTDNAVSHALAALRVAGILSVDRDGRFRRWSVKDPAIHDILHRVGATHSVLHPEH